MAARWFRNHPEWRRARAIVIDRDDICYLCGIYIDKTLRSGWMAKEVDHVYPVDLGGHPWDTDNLALTHMLCNNKKSNKTLAELGDSGRKQLTVAVKQHQAELKTSGRNYALELANEEELEDDVGGENEEA